MSALSSFAGLTAAAGFFALVVISYLLLTLLFRFKKEPQWMKGDVVAMVLCVILTGAFVAASVCVFTQALKLPFPVWGDIVSALAVVFGIAGLFIFALRYFSSGLQSTH